MRRRRVGVLVLTVLVVGAVVAAASARWAAWVDTPEERMAREQVLRLLATTRMSSRAEDIDEFARRAVARGGPELVGVSGPRGLDGAVLGRLTFRVTLPQVDPSTLSKFSLEPRTRDVGPYCFDVAFDHWGKRGERGTAQGVTLVRCPPDAPPVTPPPSDDPVVAPNAREAAWSVLSALPPAGTPSAQDVEADVTALLQEPEDGSAPLAGVDVAVEGSDVGIATGLGDDCVLVARVDGTVVDVHPPRVYLQPGELGCGGYTALADLRPPH